MVPLGNIIQAFFPRHIRLGSIQQQHGHGRGDITPEFANRPDPIYAAAQGHRIRLRPSRGGKRSRYLVVRANKQHIRQVR
jgi:hypothetical protein